MSVSTHKGWGFLEKAAHLGAQPRIDRALRWQLSLTLIAVTSCVALGYQISRRVGFRWDFFVWSESPFMTDMMKLSAGLPLYGSAADANSFVYSPGLEYITYAVLRPFGAALDVRACRSVTVAIGLLACIAVGAIGARLQDQLGVKAAAQRVFFVFGSAVCALVVGKNFTADVCHPDNLVAVQVAVSLLLGQRAISSGSRSAAFLAVGVASLGALVKQTGIAVGACALLGMILARPDLRRPARLLPLVLVWLGATALALLPIMWSPNARLWTMGILAEHFIDVGKYEQLIREDVLGVPHRVILWALAPFAAAALLLDPREEPRRFARLWLSFGLGLPLTLAAYLKHMGAWNNLMVVDLWAIAGVLPVAWSRIDAALRSREAQAAAAPVGTLLLLLMTTVPTRVPPTKGHETFGRELERAIADACAKGEHVLLGHGTMPLIRAGCRDVPLDRANSLLELDNGKVGPHAATLERIRTHYYGHIFFNARNWYNGVLSSEIRNHYETVSWINAAADQPGASGRERLDWHFGYQRGELDGNVEVLVPRK